MKAIVGIVYIVSSMQLVTPEAWSLDELWRWTGDRPEINARTIHRAS
jgi:hypothetical protein